MTEIRIDWVRIEGRYRRDLGNLETLAKSIADVGLINPVTVTSDGRLVAGQRRLEACRLLGWDTVPGRIVDNLSDAVMRLTAERDENTERKDMTISERVRLAEALEALERPKAAARQAAHGQTAPGRPANTPVHVNTSVEENGRVREVVARAVAMSPMTYYRARTVVRAAADIEAAPQQRAVAQEAMKEMDATGNVTGAYQKIRGDRPTDLGVPTKTVLQAAPIQRKALTGAVNTLSGISHGLKQIEGIHPDITSEEAAQWVDGLSESRRVIESLIKRLKERTNAQA